MKAVPVPAAAPPLGGFLGGPSSSAISGLRSPSYRATASGTPTARRNSTASVNASSNALFICPAVGRGLNMRRVHESRLISNCPAAALLN
jgi:hypothetical protein